MNEPNRTTSVDNFQSLYDGLSLSEKSLINACTMMLFTLLQSIQQSQIPKTQINDCQQSVSE